MEKKMKTTNERELVDDDYVLIEGSAWFTVKKFGIRIHETDEGVVVDVWRGGRELDQPISSCYAFDVECEEGQP